MIQIEHSHSNATPFIYLPLSISPSSTLLEPYVSLFYEDRNQKKAVGV